MISLKQSISLYELEELHRFLNTQHAATLRVPSSIKYGGGFGVPVSLIQFFASWSRQLFPPTLKLYPQSNLAAPASSLAGEPHGMAALYFSPNISTENNVEVATRDALTAVVPFIEAMQSAHLRDSMHGRGVFLCCFSSAKNEFLLPFYSKGKSGSLRGREDFITLTQKIISACVPTAVRNINEGRSEAIGNLLYELFRNTDEHARTDEFGGSYSRNMRGVMAKYVAVNQTVLDDENVRKDIPLNLFLLKNIANKRLFKAEEGRPRSGEITSFLEISVFDTGPGLAKKWMAKNAPGNSLECLSLEDEERFVKNCFERHASTKDINGSGQGLELVVRVLADLNAFLRLRTGRICLVQDFSSSKSKKFNPTHWQKDRPLLPMTSGAAFTIVIPISRDAR